MATDQCRRPPKLAALGKDFVMQTVEGQAGPDAAADVLPTRFAPTYHWGLLREPVGTLPSVLGATHYWIDRNESGQQKTLPFGGAKRSKRENAFWNRNIASYCRRVT